MQVGRADVVGALRSRGCDADADRAATELPEQIETRNPAISSC